MFFWAITIQQSSKQPKKKKKLHSTSGQSNPNSERQIQRGKDMRVPMESSGAAQHNGRSNLRNGYEMGEFFGDGSTMMDGKIGWAPKPSKGRRRLKDGTGFAADFLEFMTEDATRVSTQNICCTRRRRRVFHYFGGGQLRLLANLVGTCTCHLFFFFRIHLM